MMRMVAWGLTALWLVGCATAPLLGSSPTLVTIDVGSELRFEPQPPEAFADPTLRAFIEQCERQKQSRCRMGITGIERRTRFVRPRDARVVTLVSLKGLEPRRRYEVRYRLFDPKGEIRVRAAYFLDLPREVEANILFLVHFEFSPPDAVNWDLGRWRVEIAINGNVEGERTFEVVEWEGAASTWRERSKDAPARC